MFCKNAISGHLTVDVLGKNDVPVFVMVVHVLVRVLNLVGVVGHSNTNEYYYTNQPQTEFTVKQKNFK